MNYEEKYNEILEWARKNKARLNGVPIEEVLPELAESEDERIRKAIYDFFSLAGNVYDLYGIPKANLLAYLEKQKENPKSADSISADCTSPAKCEERWHKIQDSLPDNGRLVLAKDCLANILLARYDGENWEVSVYDNEDYYCQNTITKWCNIPMMGYKESLHIQESCKENAESLTSPNTIYTEMGEVIATQNVQEQKPEEQDIDVIKMSALLAADRLASAEMTGRLKERSEILDNPTKYGLQKPAEWSEEEYGRLFDIEHYLDGTLLLSPDRRIACIDFLKYLRSQSHWKPSEVCYGPKGDPDPAGVWKPSEEQMEALKDYADSAIDSQRDIEGNILFSLYDDLKKLTESNFEPKVPSIKEAVIKIVKSISPKVLEYEGFSREQVVKWLYDKEE